MKYTIIFLLIMKYNDLFIGVLLFTVAHFLTFYQLNGQFIWKWFHDNESVGGPNDAWFTPQNKPVESIIKEVYSTN